MLTRDQAKERLKEFRVDNWADQKVAAVAGLPEPLREAALVIPGREDRRGDIWDALSWADRLSASNLAAQRLDEASASDRRRLFEAIFPAIAPYVEQAWQLLHR